MYVTVLAKRALVRWMMRLKAMSAMPVPTTANTTIAASPFRPSGWLPTRPMLCPVKATAKAGMLINPKERDATAAGGTCPSLLRMTLTLRP